MSEDTVKGSTDGRDVSREDDRRSGGRFRGNRTRRQMLRKGVEIFSRFGPEGVSTRSLAREAGVNISAIQYYFGSKEGYYLAVVEYLLEQMEAPVFSLMQWARDHIDRLDGSLAEDDGTSREREKRTEVAKLLYTVVHAMVSSILQMPEAQYFASISTREHLTPTAAYDLIYAGISKFHEIMSLLVSRVLDIPEDSEEAVIRAHAIVGQILIFRFGAATLYRRMNISSPDRDQIYKMATLVAQSVCMSVGVQADRSFLLPLNLEIGGKGGKSHSDDAGESGHERRPRS